MPSSPSPPKYTPRSPSPTMRPALLETEKRTQAKAAKIRKGYQSTILTHGLGLASTRRQEAKAFKLGE